MVVFYTHNFKKIRENRRRYLSKFSKEKNKKYLYILIYKVFINLHSMVWYINTLNKIERYIIKYMEFVLLPSNIHACRITARLTISCAYCFKYIKYITIYEIMIYNID